MIVDTNNNDNNINNEIDINNEVKKNEVKQKIKRIK